MALQEDEKTALTKRQTARQAYLPAGADTKYGMPTEDVSLEIDIAKKDATLRRRRARNAVKRQALQDKSKLHLANESDSASSSSNSSSS